MSVFILHCHFTAKTVAPYTWYNLKLLGHIVVSLLVYCDRPVTVEAWDQYRLPSKIDLLNPALETRVILG